MLFVGKYDYTVDTQGRISLPCEWRDGAGDAGWVLLPDPQPALLLMPESYFMEFFAEARKMALADPELRLGAARLGAAARQFRCDRQGRLTLSRSVLESASITKEITLIGAVTHIRLCAPGKWVEPEVDGKLEKMLPALEKKSGDRGELAALIEGVLKNE